MASLRPPASPSPAARAEASSAPSTTTDRHLGQAAVWLLLTLVVLLLAGGIAGGA